MRAAKVDANQAEIVKALRDVGADVLSIAQLGHNAPDLIVGFRGENYIFEVKASKKSKLRPGQVIFALNWRGKYSRINSVADALKAIGL